MVEVIANIYLVFMYIVFGYACFYSALYLFGLFSHKQKYKIVEDKQKFCIFVPCHNEGPVVGATVENYRKITYNKELFDIYFIADNCSDNTAQEIRDAIARTANGEIENFNVLERNVNDPKKKGKPHALRWAMDKLEEDNAFYSKYDMFMILDADNFVDADILTHINSQYLSYKENKRPAMIQTYLDSKNNENIISRGYFATYRLSNGFFQLPKHRLGLCPTIGGTGFAMETQLLKDIGGYNCKSLTEDLEIQTIATLRCRKIVYNGNVRVYDEKPTGFKQSVVQRTRWSQGHWFVFFKYFIPLLSSLFNPRQFKYFFKKLDMLIYLCVKMFLIMGIACSVIAFGLSLVNAVPPLPQPVIIINTIVSLLSIFIVPISSLYDGTPTEKKKVIQHIIPNYLAILLVSTIEIYSAFIGLFKCGDQTTWKKTAHRVTTLHKDKEAEKEQAKQLEKEVENSMEESIIELEDQQPIASTSIEE